jgi:hypothetical protein
MPSEVFHHYQHTVCSDFTDQIFIVHYQKTWAVTFYIVSPFHCVLLGLDFTRCFESRTSALKHTASITFSKNRSLFLYIIIFQLLSSQAFLLVWYKKRKHAWGKYAIKTLVQALTVYNEKSNLLEFNCEKRAHRDCSS